MVDFDEALARLGQISVTVAGERTALARAAGRVLARPLHARCDAPRRAVAAMDGYAVADAATRAGDTLRVIGESRAGAGFTGTAGAGQAVRIFTGAPMPDGTDRCIMQEYAEQAGDTVRFAQGYGPGWHVRQAGSDFAAGELILPAGTRLSPRAIIAAAAADHASLMVAPRPRVAIISTGDELAPPGRAYQRADAIPESVGFGVAAMAVAAGARIAARLAGADNLAVLERIAGEALGEADLVIVTGGASVGERDFAKPMFAAHGLELVFAKVAIKPGKPVWLGRAKGSLVLGLPGNPTSAMVTARLFLRPLLALLQGQPLADVLRWRTLPLGAPINAAGGRETFVRAAWEEQGLVPLGNQDSGSQSALVQADWLIRRAANAPPIDRGDMVTAIEF